MEHVRKLLCFWRTNRETYFTESHGIEIDDLLGIVFILFLSWQDRKGLSPEERILVQDVNNDVVKLSLEILVGLVEDCDDLGKILKDSHFNDEDDSSEYELGIARVIIKVLGSFEDKVSKIDGRFPKILTNLKEQVERVRNGGQENNLNRTITRS